MNRIFFLLLFFLPLVCVFAQIPDLPLQVSEKSRYHFSLPETGEGVVLEGSLLKENATLVVSWSQAGVRSSFSLHLPRETKESCLIFDLATSGKPSLQQNYYIKPNPYFYVGEKRKGGWFYQFVDRHVFEEQNQVLAKYHLFTPATKHPFQLRLDVHSEGMEVWLDGRFINFIPGPPDKNSTLLEVSPGCLIIGFQKKKTIRQNDFLPLEIEYYGRPGSLELKSLNIQEDTFSSIPLKVAAWNKHIDVGLSRWLEEGIDPADFCDNYTTRSAFDGNPESIIFRIPKRFYQKAYLLCLVEPNKNKVPALGLRLTRFGNHYGDSGGRGDAFADTVVYLPEDSQSPSENIRKAGQATIILGKKEVQIPLWLVSVDLPAGQISDLLGDNFPKFGREGDFLDLELTKEIRTAVHFFAYQNCSLKPLGLPSSVHVLALTLKESPVEVKLRTKHGDFIFADEKKPSLQVILKNNQKIPFSGSLILTTEDFYNQKTTRNIPVFLPASLEKNDNIIEVDLSQKNLGWFQARITIKNKEGEKIWEEPFFYALLPADTRKAGLESPFGVWWFGSTHGGCASLDTVGPLLQKMGIRHICPSGWKNFSGEQLAKYKLSYSMAPWYGTRREEIVNTFFTKHPHVRWAMIFHETGISGRLTQMFYPELLNLPAPELTPEENERFQKLWQQALEAARLYREKLPGVKITFGNSSSPLMIQFMRAKFPKEYIDAFGIEGVSAWKMPERQPELGNFQEVWWLQEMKKIYGYQDIPVSSGFEWICRCTQPGALSWKDQAAYYVRDALHALAYGMPSINIGLLEDVADSYYYTIYGASGFLMRNPLLYPKISYVAMATLTRVLDQAKYQQAWDTGSTSLYAFQFQRGKETILAVWTLRGERQVLIKSARQCQSTFIDSMGNVTPVKIDNQPVSIKVSAMPGYLICPEKVVSVTAGESFLDDSLPAKVYILDSFSSPESWQLLTETDEELETNAFDNPARAGKGTISAVFDEKKGPVTEVTLLPQPEIPAVCPRYLILKPKKTILVPTAADSCGLVIKGNSSWSRVIWEFKDAKGERWISIGYEPDRWNVSDWESQTYINFDGWCNIRLGFPCRYPGGYHGPRDRNWKYEGGDGIMDFPLVLQRLILEMRDRLVYGTEMKKVSSPSIRLQNLWVTQR